MKEMKEKIEPRQRIILALDVKDVRKATELIQTLSPHVGYFKVGLEFITSMIATLLTLPYTRAEEELAAFREMFDALKEQVFWDNKFMDISNTIGESSQALVNLDTVAAFNVHTLGGRAMMEAAVTAAKSAKRRPKVWGVTILTSLGFEDLQRMTIFPELTGIDPALVDETRKNHMEKLVLALAVLAQQSGLDGVIASAKEAAIIREARGPDFQIVTPAIRPQWAAVGDQKRPVTPADAIRAGSDYLVIGRPITKPPDEIGSPVEAAKRIAEEIAQAA